TGNYFARQRRNSSRLEWLETVSLNRGAHDFKFGLTAARTTFNGSFDFRPIQIQNADGQLLEKIEFTAGAPFETHDIDAALFTEEHWKIVANVTSDWGARVEQQAITHAARLGPRIGVAWNPLREENLVLRGGFGVFYDRVPLSVRAFSYYPEQIITN